MLSTSDFAALSRLLDEALDLPAAAREAWLAALPTADAHLRARLKAMLEAHRAGDHLAYLEDGPRMARIDETVARAGEFVGPYRLVRQIGRGGMGTVWLAARADGTMRRQVALKLPRLAWGAGLAARMQREREIGELLEHPHIARLYDAGVDAAGRPFLAFEYVDGRPLDAWCRDHACTLEARLRLFLQIAGAVAYAHGRLVVHRDLKPSNVLVTADGHAHLLDFGIAKLLTEGADDEDGLTRDQGRVLTPRCASPEQLSGGVVTVASDVYSLAVLLYGLLAGTHPYAVKRDTVAAIEEAILEGEPKLASQRAADRTLAARLRGDLDAILAKALMRDPASRYATVDAMAADIERHLKGEVVLARPDRLGYRLAVSLRRHRLPFGAGAAVLAAVLVGSGLSILEARRANGEAERARLVKEFVVDIFSTRAGPDGSLGQMPGRALLERSARMIDRKFGSQPLLKAELYGVMSTMFFNISDPEQAARYAAQQVDALTTAGASRLQVAQALMRLARVDIPMERDDDALRRARQALALSDGEPALQASAHAYQAMALLFGSSDTTGAGAELDAAEKIAAHVRIPASDLANVTHARGLWFSFRNQADQARASFDRTIALGLAAEGPSSRQALDARSEAAKTLILAHRFEAGKSYLDEAVRMMRAAGGPNDVSAAMWESYGADWMFFGGGMSFADAMRIQERSLAVMRSQNWSLPPRYEAGVRLRIGSANLLWGDVERGSTEILASVDAETVGSGPMAQWWKQRLLVRALTPTRRADKAAALARDLLTVQKAWPTSDLRGSYRLLALALVHARRYADAAAALAEFDALPPTVRRYFATEGNASVKLDDVRLLVALERGDPQTVIRLTSVQDGGPAGDTDVHWGETAALARASALCEARSRDDGLRLFAVWLPRLATDRYAMSPQLAYWQARMGLCALDAGHRAQALDVLRSTRAALALQPDASPHSRGPADRLARRLESA